MENKAPIPKYYQVQEFLRELINSLDYDAAIPSEAELCNTLSVSRITIRKAIDGLVQEGLLYRVQGRGTFVAERVLTQKYPERFVDRISGFYADMTSRGFKVTTKVVETDVSVPSASVREKLNLDITDKVFNILRIRYVDGEPNHIVETFLPIALYPGIEKADFSKGSLYAYIIKKYNADLHRARIHVESSLSTKWENNILGIEPNSPILLIKSQVFNSKGEPILCGYSRLRADVSQVEFEIISSESK